MIIQEYPCFWCNSIYSVSVYWNISWVEVGGALMHHLHPTRHANTAPIHPRDGGRRNGSGPKFPSPDLRDQLLSSLTTPISISASDSNDGQYAPTSSTSTAGGGKWPNGSDMGSVNIFSRFEILCWESTRESCTIVANQFSPCSRAGWPRHRRESGKMGE